MEIFWNKIRFILQQCSCMYGPGIYIKYLPKTSPMYRWTQKVVCHRILNMALPYTTWSIQCTFLIKKWAFLKRTDWRWCGIGRTCQERPNDLMGQRLLSGKNEVSSENIRLSEIGREYRFELSIFTLRAIYLSTNSREYLLNVAFRAISFLLSVYALTFLGTRFGPTADDAW